MIMLKKVYLSLLSLILLALTPFGVFASQNESVESSVSIVLTQAEYDDLEAKGKLPKEFPIEVMEPYKLPAGAVKVEDPVNNTDIGKKLSKHYGPNLEKVVFEEGDKKIIEKVELK